MRNLDGQSFTQIALPVLQSSARYNARQEWPLMPINAIRDL